MKIREAQAEDANALTKLAHAAKQSWGYPEELMQAWSAALTFDAAVLSAMHVGVAEGDAGILGFYALMGSGHSVQLEHLWVWPDQMGKGVGRSLVDHALAAAARRGAEVLVIESDPNAEAFYRRLGAVRVGTIPAPAPGYPDRTLPVLEVAINRGAPYQRQQDPA